MFFVCLPGVGLCFGGLRRLTAVKPARVQPATVPPPATVQPAVVVQRPPAPPEAAAARLCRPNLSGEWVLAELAGDFEAFLVDMKQPYLNRITAKALRYGLGKVVVKCTQTGDDEFFFAKTLVDPRQLGEVTSRCCIGREGVYQEDLGKVAATPRWEGDVLVFDGVAQSTKLSLQTRMYHDDRGHFVQEVTSCRGRVITYTFHARR